MKQLIDWKSHFDQIFCISFTPYHNERITRITQQLDKVGILNSGIFQWKYTYASIFWEKLKSVVTIQHQNVKDGKIGMFNTAFAHYEISKIAKNLGYQRILVLEEDIVFLKDINKFASLINSFPKSDVVLFDKFTFNRNQYQNWERQPNSGYLPFNGINFYSGAFYSINSKAIDAFIKQNEQSFFAVDELWNNSGINVECNKLSKTAAVTNLGIQKSFSNSVNTNIDQQYSQTLQIDYSMYD